MTDMTDYVSNPKSEKWTSPEYAYTARIATVKNKRQAGRQNVRRWTAKFRSYEQAQEIVDYWNNNDDEYTYILTGGGTL
jgi:hypothetical protein